MILFWWACAQASTTGDLVCIEDAEFNNRSGLVIEAALADLSDPIKGRAIDPVVHGSSHLKVESNTVEWDLKAGSAQFRGDVKAIRGGVVLKAAQLDVILDKEQQIKTAIATQNVEIEAGERKAFCGQADLDVLNGKLQLSENPRVVTPKGTFIGEQLIIWLDDDKIQCEGSCRVVLSEDE